MRVAARIVIGATAIGIRIIAGFVRACIVFAHHHPLTLTVIIGTGLGILLATR